MEANCLVFPSPQKYNVQPVIYKIVLIPQNQHQSHIYYHNYLNLCSYSGDDDFQSTISRINKDQSKNSSKIIKEQSSMRNNLSNEKSIQKSFIPQRIQTSMSEKNQFQRKINQEKNIRNSTNNVKIQTNLQKTKVNPKQYIPCLFLPGRKDKIIVFFHANAQDITSASQFLKMICYETQYSILAIQYRGYSIFGGQTNPQAINNDSQRVIQYLLGRKILTDQLIIFGRSIGCAVALSVVNQAKFYCVVLLSPFLSLKKIAKQLYGNCAGWALKQGFNNQQSLSNINSPLLLIHGLKDTLVPYQHSLALLSQCKAYCQAKIIQNMTHSRFNFREDFIKHFKLFLLELD